MDTPLSGSDWRRRAVGARITTLELEAEKVAVAEANFAKAGLSDVITVIQGDGKQTLATLAGPYDLVFLDAAKEDYAAYFDLIYPSPLSRGCHCGGQRSIPWRVHGRILQQSAKLTPIA